MFKLNLNMKTQQMIITIMTLTALILSIITATLFTIKCDFTADNTYKISKVTKETLRGLEDKVRVNFYLSGKVLQQRPFAQTTVDLLQEIASASRGKMELRVINLTAKNLADYQADLTGLQSWQIQMSDGKSSASVDLVYSGLTLSYKGKQETIPMIREHNYQQIEYEVVSDIRKMAYDYQLKIGLLNTSGKPSTPPQSPEDIYKMGYSILIDQSATVYEDFSFVPVSLGEKIDPSFTAVVVIGAADIDDQQLLIFDQYIMRGGSIFFAIEQDEVLVDPQNQNMPISLSSYRESPIMNFLNHHGVEFEQGKLMDVKANQTLAQTGQGQYNVVPVVFQPRILDANKDYPFLTAFSEINLYWPDALRIIDPTSQKSEANGEEGGVEIDILLQTSKASAIASNPNPQALFDPSMGYSVYQMTPQESQKSYPVSLHVHGELTSYFDGKEIPQKPGEDPLYSEIVKSTDIGQFIILSDVEFLSDIVFGTDGSGQRVLIQNFQFLRNIAEYLGGDKELLQVRTKIPGARVFTATAEELNQASITALIINLGVVPFLIIVFAITWLIIRRKRASRSSYK